MKFRHNNDVKPLKTLLAATPRLFGFFLKGGGNISLTTKVIVMAWMPLMLGCGSDGSEVQPIDKIATVPYVGGMWKFEDGQRYYLKSVDSVEGIKWEVG